MTRILLTGANGFVGRALVPRLAHHSLSLLTRTNGDLTKPRVEWELPPRIDTVVHTAAQIDETDRDTMRCVNVDATETLVRWAIDAGAKTFLFLSTGGVYGPRPDPADESAPLNPVGLYAQTKAEAEQIIGNHSNRLIVQIARIYFPYGPGQRRRFLPTLITRVTQHLSVTLNNEAGEPVLSMTWIDDVAEALVRVMQIDQSVTVNIAGEKASVRTVATMIAELTGSEAQFKFRGEPAGLNYIAAIKRLRALTGFEAQTSVRNGLIRTIQAGAR